MRPGQRVRFLHLRGDPDVHAWNLSEPPDPARLDVNRYRTLLMRAASAVVQPLGKTRAPACKARCRIRAVSRSNSI